MGRFTAFLIAPFIYGIFPRTLISKSSPRTTEPLISQPQQAYVSSWLINITLDLIRRHVQRVSLLFTSLSITFAISLVDFQVTSQQTLYTHSLIVVWHSALWALPHLTSFSGNRVYAAFDNSQYFRVERDFFSLSLGLVKKLCLLLLFLMRGLLLLLSDIITILLLLFIFLFFVSSSFFWH